MKISIEESDKLKELHQTASTTPVITLSMGSPDASSLAWNRVREYMDELGKKYGYNPAEYAIDLETCEVKRI
jgi:hypothetical protein